MQNELASALLDVVLQGQTALVNLTTEEKSALSEVLTKWDIRRVDSLRQAESGVSNRVFLLKTERGSFALRAYRVMPRERLDWEHRIIQQASGVGIPTPLQIPTDTDASYLNWKGGQYALFPWIEDEQLERKELTPNHARAMGRFLADMEQRFGNLNVLDAPRQRLVVQEEGSTDKALTGIEELLRIIRALPHHSAQETLALSYLQGQQRWLKSLSRRALSQHEYHLRLIHGDYQNNNLFFSQGAVSAIIDWERARLAPGGWDIVRALHLMFELEPTLCRAFVQGYQSVTSIDASELAVTANLYGEEQDTDTWLLRAIYREGNKRARRFLKSGEFRLFSEKWRELLPHLPL
ncbi:MAG: hypothetical protein EOP06_10535 [Proteobacteria bacterium]|nr:MAG: hypothetical protein EOP06_10535 [Pseudomonadota bacterium]